jgi:nitroimidazol reductase NimA-like FMN-containing flavoprotein (pyridoxamine 5'-phosphate oxidase superfamily)
VIKESDFKKSLTDLFSSQSLAVLSTYGRGQPYGSLVAFVATDDLKWLLFATTRATRKYANLSSESRVAMVVDNRSNEASDFHNAIGVTAMGTAQELMGAERDRSLELYLRKHPFLKEFGNSPTCALFKVHVERYYMVSQFQNVVELDLTDENHHSSSQYIP